MLPSHLKFWSTLLIMLVFIAQALNAGNQSLIGKNVEVITFDDQTFRGNCISESSEVIRINTRVIGAIDIKKSEISQAYTFRRATIHGFFMGAICGIAIWTFGVLIAEDNSDNPSSNFSENIPEIAISAVVCGAIGAGVGSTMYARKPVDFGELRLDHLSQQQPRSPALNFTISYRF